VVVVTASYSVSTDETFRSHSLRSFLSQFSLLILGRNAMGRMPL